MHEMTPEERVLLACSRLVFSESKKREVVSVCRQVGLQWELIHSTAEFHGVAPLVYANLQRCSLYELSMPKEIVERFRRTFVQNLVIKQRLAAKIATVLELLNRLGIDVMLIKGAALDLLVYGSNPYTTSRDVDLILRPKRREIAEADFEQIADMLHGRPFEYDFFVHHDIDLNGVLPIDFRQVWDDAIKLQFKARDVFVMSPEDLLIAASINCCRKRYFRLKALCDLDAIIRMTEGLRWGIVVSKARAYQCADIVFAAILVAERFMGCRPPEEVFQNLIDSSARRAIIRLLSERMSFSSLVSLNSERVLLGRRMGLSLLLPYASYRRDQVLRKLKFVWSVRPST